MAEVKEKTEAPKKVKVSENLEVVSKKISTSKVKSAPKVENKPKIEAKSKIKKEEIVEDAILIDEEVEVEVPEKVLKATPKEELLNWGILHIYSSYNNTHLHVTDITGSETITKVTGGMVSKSDRLKPSPNVAMAAAKQVSESCLAKGYNALYVKLRAVGGHNGPMTPGPGSQAAVRMLTRYGIRLGRIEDVTPVPHDSCRKKGGKRGRRV